MWALTALLDVFCSEACQAQSTAAAQLRTWQCRHSAMPAQLVVLGGRHLGRDVLGAQLSLDMRVVELGDERVGPGLAGVDGDVHVVLPVPLPPLLRPYPSLGPMMGQQGNALQVLTVSIASAARRCPLHMAHHKDHLGMPHWQAAAGSRD